MAIIIEAIIFAAVAGMAISLQNILWGIFTIFLLAVLSLLIFYAIGVLIDDYSK